MDNASVIVRHSDTGKPADDLCIGITEVADALNLESADVTVAVDARIAASANAVTIAAQTWVGLATATTAQLGSDSHAINTTGKVKGKVVYDTTTDLLVFSLGAATTSKWRLSGAVDSTGDITPST